MVKSGGGGGPKDFSDSPDAKLPFLFLDLIFGVWGLDFGLVLDLGLVNL